MRNLLIASVAVIALAGCQTIDTIDAYIKKNLPIACSGLDVAHIAFGVANQAHPFNATILQSEATAYANAKAICEHPETANSVALVTTVLQTAIQINGYLRQAQAAGVE